MQIPDVNALVNAFHPLAVFYAPYRRWLDEASGSDESLAIPDLVLLGFVRVSLNRKVWDPPPTLDRVLAFVDELRSLPNFVPLEPSKRHWRAFANFCRTVGTRPDDFTDNYLAALAIENEAELISADRGFARFPGLRWRDPSRP